MNRRGGTHSTCLQHSVRNKTYLQRIKEVVISPMEAVRTIETVRRLEGMRMGRGYEESKGCEAITLTIVRGHGGGCFRIWKHIRKARL